MWCCINDSELLEIVAKYSPKKLCEIKMCYSNNRIIDLEHVFISWAIRTSQKPLSLIMINYACYPWYLPVIEKFKKLGVIKKCEFVQK